MARSIGIIAIVAIVGGGLWYHNREVGALRQQLEHGKIRAASETEDAYARGYADGRATAAAAEKAASEEIARLRARVLELMEKPRRPERFGGEPDVQVLHQRALAFEREGNGAAAVKTYIQAARAGSGKAARRLGEIYDKGIAGVRSDRAESLRWYNAARAWRAGAAAAASLKVLAGATRHLVRPAQCRPRRGRAGRFL